MKKFLASVTTAFLIAAGGVAITTTAANATPPEVCIPSEAWTETIVVTPEIPAVPAVPAVPEVAEVSHFEYQRYSWTGGPTETAPVEVPPHANWQANTTNYEGAGHGTDPIGVAFPKNDNGKADWFFWTKTKVVDQAYVPGTPEIPGKPAVPAVTKTVEHPAVTCDEDPVAPTVSAAAVCEEGLAEVSLTNPNDFLIYADYSVFDSEGNPLFGDGFPLEAGETESSGSTAPEHNVEDATYTVTTSYRANIQDEPTEGPSTTFTVDCEDEPTTYLPSCTTVTDAQVLVGDGVISVEGDWASESIAVPFSGTLADIGTVLDIQADPIQYVGLHIDTAEGTISFEEEPSYGGNLWSQSTWEGVEAGMGYPAFGSITDYIEFNGDVTVTGIRLLYTHPEASTTTVESFTIGCTVYTFEPVVIPEQPEPRVVVTTDEVVDCETDTVTTTVTTTTYPTTYDEETNSWVEGEGVVTTAVSDREATDEECPVVVTPTPTPTETPAAVVSAADNTPDALAVTGAPTMAPFLWFAGSVIAAGTIAIIAMALVQRRRKAEEASAE